MNICHGFLILMNSFNCKSDIASNMSQKSDMKIPRGGKINQYNGTPITSCHHELFTINIGVATMNKRII